MERKRNVKFGCLFFMFFLLAVSIAIICIIPYYYSSTCYTTNRWLAKPMNYNTSDIFIYNSTEYKTFDCIKQSDNLVNNNYSDYIEGTSQDTLAIRLIIYIIFGFVICCSLSCFIYLFYLLVKNK